MYTLYGKKGSGSAAVEAALAVAHVPVDIIETASWARNDAYDALLAVNPLGQIPTLVQDDGSVLSESAAILIHLGTVHADSPLLPAPSSARGQAVRGLVYIAANCYAAISIIDYPERWCADADDDDTVKERIRAGTRARLHRHWEIFADVFPPSGIAGERPGALGILAAVVSRWSGARAHLAQHRPALHAALLQVDAHPDVAPVFARHWPRTA